VKLTLLQVPYHYNFARARVGAGLGPVRYVEAQADARLRQLGFEVALQTIERAGKSEDVPAAVVEGNTALAAEVARAVASDSFPLVLCGSCSACLGVLAGLSAPVGIIWFDAHGDYNTPETTPSGFFDGMPLAVANGLCYQELHGRISSSPPVPPAHTLLVGVRDLDPGERDNLARAEVLLVTGAEIRALGARAALEPKLKTLRARTGEIYLHFDIDVLDPEFAPGVDYPSSNGLRLSDAEEAIGLIAELFRVRAASLTAYNPDREANNRTLQTGLHLLTVIGAAASPSRRH